MINSNKISKDHKNKLKKRKRNKEILEVIKDFKKTSLISKIVNKIRIKNKETAIRAKETRIIKQNQNKSSNKIKK